MHDKSIIIIGAGLAGVSSAYALLKRGFAVTLVDAAAGPGQGASHANGGMLHPSIPAPWNGPGVGHHLLSSIFNPRAAMKLRLSALPDLTLWGMKFLRHSLPAKHWPAVEASYALSVYSTECTRRVRDELGLEFDSTDKGILKVFQTEADMIYPLKVAAKLKAHGLETRRLNAAETVELEPALSDVANNIAGALYSPNDGAGDAYKFTCALFERFTDNGGKAYFNRPVTGLRMQKQRCIGVRTRKGDILADRVVVAAGARAPILTKPQGIHLPLKPAKGYSLTVAGLDTRNFPKLPVISESLHAAIAPLNGRLRISGTAEFAGFDKTLTPSRLQNLKDMLAQIYPGLLPQLDMENAVPWCDFRPMSADGLPFIGRTKIPGLWINSGHGHLGWTMASGSAELLADLMTGDKHHFDSAVYRPER